MNNAALARLIAGQVCIHAAMSGMRMATPLLALREGFSTTAVGFLLALFSLTQVFLALPAGRYADRHGLKRPVAIAVVISCVGSSLAVLFPRFELLCVAALATGAASGAAIIALQRHVGRATQDASQIKRVFSWLAIGPALSNFLGPFFAGLLIDHAGAQPGSVQGYQAAFGLMALLPLATWAWIRTTPEMPQTPAPAQAERRRAWDLLADPAMRRLLLVNWCLSSCWDVHTFVVPLLGHERGMSASVIGTILGAFAIAATMVRMALPLLAKRVHEAVVVTCAMVATAVLFALYPLLPTPWAMGVCSVLLGFSLGSVQPMIMSMLHHITPTHRQGEALGLRLMTINISSVLMPLMFGTAGAVIGVSGLFWVAGAAVGSGGRMAWRMRPPAAVLTADKTRE